MLGMAHPTPEAQPGGHYHVLIASRPPGRGVMAFFVRGHNFGTRQAGQQWASRREPDPRYRMVIACTFDAGDCPRHKRTKSPGAQERITT